ncbi:hypothetical protein DICVIV_06425 [Dictyocaulus viviparus]|uniref:Ephrin RBD domain-containing protein n=1 Tax=Dictyocaulus viviparus TaxID=29172 RepID=A0A0D8XUI1_DICVI|nr:hypothetical protein DICVIV_06425 [Dictyocaulus viviparus]
MKSLRIVECKFDLIFFLVLKGTSLIGPQRSNAGAFFVDTSPCSAIYQISPTALATVGAAGFREEYGTPRIATQRNGNVCSHNGSRRVEHSLAFDVSNTDHVIPVDIGDRISLICPQPNKENYEYSNIYAKTTIT